MRKSNKQEAIQPTIVNFSGVDLHNSIERKAVLTELEITREIGNSIGEHRNVKSNFMR